MKVCEDKEPSSFPKMPFRVSTFTNDGYEDGKSGQSVGIVPHYCTTCFHHAVVLKGHVTGYKRRKTDQSFVIPPEEVLDNVMGDGGVKLVRREKGLERQFRLKCPGCGVWLGYKSSPKAHPDPETLDALPYYILKDAVTTTFRGTQSVPQCLWKDSSGVRISVCVSPVTSSSARVESVEGDCVVVALTYTNSKGVADSAQANDELVSLLAGVLEVPVERIGVRAGAKDQWKICHVTYMSLNETYEKLKKNCIHDTKRMNRN